MAMIAYPVAERTSGFNVFKVVVRTKKTMSRNQKIAPGKVKSEDNADLFL